MRVLVATTAGAGHFAALRPFAAALRDAGHQVRVAAPASFGSTVKKAGFEYVPLADVPPEEQGAIYARLPGLSRIEANQVVVREVFGGTNVRAALPGMQAVVGDWRPELILRESGEFASYVVAERTGTPHVQASISIGSLEEFFLPLVDDALRGFGAERGSAGVAAAPELTMVPSSLDDTRRSSSRETFRFRFPPPAASATDLPQGWWPDNQSPLVYVTFGSVAASLNFFPDFYRAVLTALADLPARVLLTLGEAGDPELLGPLPPNAHVERWWPQEDLMEHAAAMVGHGGFGTTMLGLSAGVPMVVVPLFAFDQFANARRVQDVGAGVALEDEPPVPERIREALERLLRDDAYQSAAERVGDEMAQLPPPSACVPVLEKVAANGMAVPRS